MVRADRVLDGPASLNSNHSTLGVRVIKKKDRFADASAMCSERRSHAGPAAPAPKPEETVLQRKRVSHPLSSAEAPLVPLIKPYDPHDSVELPKHRQCALSIQTSRLSGSGVIECGQRTAVRAAANRSRSAR